ncbi:MAG: type I-E CRISPR-associated protein Cas6/Cse3/CasE [Planctomycetota bacterium]|nr:type I-E CRISPR-associated protein Cas6/Cse3/CasE [Planctomycetota bacterium]
MYHSHLLINTGDNPDRVDWQRTRAWLRNLYRVHQRLCMAFPDKDKSLAGKSEAEHFAEYCKPFTPFQIHKDDPFQQADEDCASPDVHQPRSPYTGFLYRIDYPVIGSLRRPVIVVQSANRPDWDHAFGLNPGSGAHRNGDTPPKPPKGNADFLLAAPPQVREIDIDADTEKLVLKSGEFAHEAKPGDQLWFILRANVVETRTGNDGKKGRHRLRIDEEIMNACKDAKTDEERLEANQKIEQARRQVHLDWLRKKLGDAAELVVKTINEPKPEREHPFIETGWAHASRGDYDKGGKTPKEDMRWWAVTYTGKLTVQDPAKLRSLIHSGIGPAKAFGFGLLSVARA